MASTNKHNRLVHEKSPYLLQHQENPVHWYAWGEEAFAAAREEKKPIFLSIGYSTCHWCHVMAHESFENPEVAAVINEYFIPVKVDREERPDVDEIYMAAIHAMGQRGGWPLSMFLTPDLKPFYGGTYWPREQFLIILEKLAMVWKEHPDKIFGSGEQILEYVKAQKSAELGERELSEKVFAEFYRYSEATFDRYWGGFGHAPKFPHSMQLALLLRIHRRTQEPLALEMATHSLKRMAHGGLYDHIGGGFSRYSTDERWLIPHFEKMLYDNALLAKLYLEAYQATGEGLFAKVARETLDYVLRDLTDPRGGFYSAEDADSEGEEGKFYVWTHEELKRLLSPAELDLLHKAYGVTVNGNFEHQSNHFALQEGFDWGIKEDPLLKSAAKKLFEARCQRVRPHRDEKILTSWNALMISAMALGSQVLQEPKYLKAAQDAADFILKTSGLRREGKLLARYCAGEVKHAAYLDDYAFLIQALLDLYQCDFEPEFLQTAMQLQGTLDALFWDAAKGGYFFSDGSDPSLLVRSKESGDGALPNGNAVSALNLLKLFDLTGDTAYRDRAQALFKAFSKVMVEYPHACAQLLIAYDYLTDPSSQLVLAAPLPTALALLPSLSQPFLPNKVLAWTDGRAEFPPLVRGKVPLQGKPAYYPCRAGTCQNPTSDEKAALAELERVHRYSLGA